MQFTLDVSKWRCGFESENKLGDGNTMLLNDEGYMCCLGQFSQQCGVLQDDLLYACMPDELSDYPEIQEIFLDEDNYCNTMTNNLVAINDRETITTDERIQEIINELNENGHELVVINNPHDSNDPA